MSSESSVVELQGGELKVWYIPQVPMKAFEVAVPDLKTAKLVLDTICALSLFEYENRVKPDYADAGGVVRYEVQFHGGGSEDFTGEWCDVDEHELDEVSA